MYRAILLVSNRNSELARATGDPQLSNLVSVITPAFNREKYIKETVDSVLAQEGVDFEYIVVDDGSTDGTYEILKEYSEQGKIQLVSHPERQNRGQSASLNIGLSLAKGNFIAILDSDDLFKPGKLKKQVQFLESNPDVGLVYGNGDAVDEEGNYIYTIHPAEHIETNDPNRVLLDCYFLLPQNSLVRREIYEKVGRFDEGYRAAQDHDMLVRIAEVSKLAYIQDNFFSYRRHNDSISSKGKELRWRTGFSILEKARGRYPYKKSTVQKRKAVLNFRLGQSFINDGKFFKAFYYFVRSFFFDPVRAFKVLVGLEKVS